MAGRKPHEATEERKAQVGALASFGIPHEKIADFMGIHENTLRKYYSDVMESEKVRRHAEAANFLYRLASGRAISDGASYADCLRANMFLLKTQYGYRETDRKELTGKDGGPINTDSMVTVKFVDSEGGSE